MPRRTVLTLVVFAAAASVLHWGSAEVQAGVNPGAVRTMTESDARFYVRRTIRKRAGEGYGASGSYRISCRRLSRLRFSCRFDAFAGDSGLVGRGQVAFSRNPDDNYIHYRYKVKYYDDYCLNVTQRHNPNRNKICTRDTRWTS